MRRSPLRHPIAVLRQVIGLGQKEFAELVGKRPPTIQAIELGKLKLSETLAAKIEEQTGVNSSWLLDGDVNSPMVNQSGASYAKDDYELAQAKHSPLPKGINKWPNMIAYCLGQYRGEEIAGILAAANRLKPSMLNVAQFRLGECLRELQEKFGEAPDDYLEFRARVKSVFTDPEGNEWESGGVLAPSLRDLHYENFARSVREKYSPEEAASILEDTSKPSNQKVKKSSGSSEKRRATPTKSRQHSRES